jgi:arylsulfatase A-like enzyme
MDQQIGRILEALERTGHAENTIVVYTADHGLSVGQHGLLGKQNLYEHSVRVPAVVAGPGVPAGWRCGALCHSHDLMPTVCDLTGVAKPEGVEATSLAPLLRGGAEQVREEVGSVYWLFQRMITDGRWKFIRYYRDEEKRRGEDRVQLFDLWADPQEKLNLRDDPTQQQRLRAMAERLEQWQQRMGDELAGRPGLP